MSDTVYSANTIADCQQELAALAKEPRTHFNKREAVAVLFEDIEAALVNHTYSEVAKRLGKSGIDISAGSLKQYMLKLKRERQGATKKTSGSSKRNRRNRQPKPAVEKSASNTPPSQTVTKKRVLPEPFDEVKTAY